MVEGERGIAGIGWAEGEAEAVKTGAAWLRPVGEALDTLWKNPAAGFGFSLELAGTPFQWRVWEALRGIPWGETVTYGALAAQLGRPGSARAVAGAVAANRHALVFPCHRVIPMAGGVGGYRWGGERKRALLERERAIGEARARG